MTFIRSTSQFQSWIVPNDGGNTGTINVTHFKNSRPVQGFTVTHPCDTERRVRYLSK